MIARLKMRVKKKKALINALAVRSCGAVQGSTGGHTKSGAAMVGVASRATPLHFAQIANPP